MPAHGERKREGGREEGRRRKRGGRGREISSSPYDLFNRKYLLKGLFSNISTMGVKVSTFEFWGAVGSVHSTDHVAFDILYHIF